MRTPGRGLVRLIALLGALVLMTAACLGEGGGGGGDGGDTAGGTEGGGGGGGGGEVEIMGAFTGVEGDQFRDALQPFIEESGINVTYNDVPDFNTVITTRVEGGDIPDIALFPQPGLLLDTAQATDSAVPVSEYLDIAALEETLIPGFLDAATGDDGTVWGFPMRMAVKSALWYPMPEFEEAGYEVPETYEDLNALEEQIIADGGTPWCLGMESGDATGWYGTDWIEEFMLRLWGPEQYDAWVEGELPFDSPEVREAFQYFEEIWSASDMVVGGTQGVLGIDVQDSPDVMFDDPPGCWLHRQGNFATAFFPDAVNEDIDANVGVAYFPPIEDGDYDGRPVLAGGDLAMLMNDTDAARQVMEFLASPEFGEPWAESGGWLSPHRTFDDSLYPSEVERQLFQIGAQADVLRFDASDLMPGPVGTGSFWTGLVDWIGGQASLDAVLANIDSTYPESDVGGGGGDGGEASPSPDAGGDASPSPDAGGDASPSPSP